VVAWFGYNADDRSTLQSASGVNKAPNNNSSHVGLGLRIRLLVGVHQSSKCRAGKWPSVYCTSRLYLIRGQHLLLEWRHVTSTWGEGCGITWRYEVTWWIEQSPGWHQSYDSGQWWFTPLTTAEPTSPTQQMCSIGLRRYYTGMHVGHKIYGLALGGRL